MKGTPPPRRKKGREILRHTKGERNPRQTQTGSLRAQIFVSFRNTHSYIILIYKKNTSQAGHRALSLRAALTR
jgi:hypothetical protein